MTAGLPLRGRARRAGLVLVTVTYVVGDHPPLEVDVLVREVEYHDLLRAIEQGTAIHHTWGALRPTADVRFIMVRIKEPDFPPPVWVDSAE